MEDKYALNEMQDRIRHVKFHYLSPDNASQRGGGSGQHPSARGVRNETAFFVFHAFQDSIMALTYSTMQELGSTAPFFDLPVANPSADGLSGDRRNLNDYAADALVVVFTCNHCPFAKHVEDALIRSAADWSGKGAQFVLISANDARGYPEDSFGSMAARAAEKAYPFPYLYDESQEVAKAYGAVCTPDFFVYGPDRKLAYRGRYDETRPGMGAATGKDLHEALDMLLSSGAVLDAQVPSIGCNIKWKPGNEPA